MRLHREAQIPKFAPDQSCKTLVVGDQTSGLALTEFALSWGQPHTGELPTAESSAQVTPVFEPTAHEMTVGRPATAQEPTPSQGHHEPSISVTLKSGNQAPDAAKQEKQALVHPVPEDPVDQQQRFAGGGIGTILLITHPSRRLHT